MIKQNESKIQSQDYMFSLNKISAHNCSIHITVCCDFNIDVTFIKVKHSDHLIQTQQHLAAQRTEIYSLTLCYHYLLEGLFFHIQSTLS